jgi:hypothetical protein
MSHRRNLSRRHGEAPERRALAGNKALPERNSSWHNRDGDGRDGKRSRLQ